MMMSRFSKIAVAAVLQSRVGGILLEADDCGSRPNDNENAECAGMSSAIFDHAMGEVIERDLSIAPSCETTVDDGSRPSHEDSSQEVHFESFSCNNAWFLFG